MAITNLSLNLLKLESYFASKALCNYQEQIMADNEKIEENQRVEKNNFSQQKETNLYSEHKKEYFDFFGDLTITNQEVKQLTHRLFQKERIRYNPNKFTQELTWELVDHDPGYKIVHINVFLGNFCIPFFINNQDRQSPSHHCYNKTNAKHINLFLAYPQHINEAIKCFQFSSEEKPLETFGMALKECCLLRIASGLGVGPQFTRYSGFDMIIYESCIEFEMELCLRIEQINRISEQNPQQVIKDLKKKIRILHNFKIVHIDIKPMNIMTSKLKKQLVYLDFGFSQVIQEPIGLKSYSLFKGTLQFCCPEMKALYLQKKLGRHPIDLYYNDIYSLQLTLNHIATRLEQIQEKQTFQQYLQMQLSQNYSFLFSQQTTSQLKYMTVMRIKSQIYLKKKEFMQNTYELYILVQFTKIFISFIAEQPYSKSSHDAYTFITEHTKIAWPALTLEINMQLKKQIFLNSQPSNSNQSKVFLNRMDLTKDQCRISYSYDCFDISFSILTSQRQKLFLKQLAVQMPKVEYYWLLIQNLDLRSIQSTFQQKITFLKVFKEVEHSQAFLSEKQELTQCLKIILNYFLTSFDQHFQFVIPAAIVNLVILQAISTQQLMKIFQRAFQVNENSFKTVLLLVRCYLVRYWINFKVVSSYHSIDVQEFIVNCVQRRIKQLQNQSFVLIALRLTQVQPNYKSQISGTFQNLHLFLKDQEDIDDETVNELMSLDIYQQESFYLQQKKVSRLNTLYKLLQLGRYLFKNPKKIDYIHLLLLNDDNSALSIEVISKIFFQVISCLSESRVLPQFTVNYDVLALHKGGELCLFSKAKELFSLLSRPEYKYSFEVVRIFYRMINEIARTHSYSSNQETKKILEQIFNIQYLQNLPFPQNYDQTNKIIFYQTAMNICLLLFKLYKSSSAQLSFLPIFYQQLEDYRCSIQCQYCKSQSYPILKQIQFKLLFENNKREQVIMICKQQIEKLQNSPNISFKMNQIHIYLEKIIFALLDFPQTTLLQKYKIFTYQIIKKYNIFHHIFLTKNGSYFFVFISCFSLIELLQIIQFFNFHKKIMNFLYQYPIKRFAQAYQKMNFLFNRNFRSLMVRNIDRIVKAYFTERILKLNAYSCLFFCLILHLIDPKSKYYLKAVANICKNVDSVSLTAKVIAMTHFFSYQFQSNNMLEGIRQRRRKTILYAHYLTNKKVTLKIFCDKIGLKTIFKKRRGSFFNLLQAKIRLLYNNLFI